MTSDAVISISYVPGVVFDTHDVRRRYCGVALPPLIAGYRFRYPLGREANCGVELKSKGY